MPTVSSGFLPALLDSLLEAVITIDGHGRIRGCNRAAEQLFGHAAADVIGQDVGVLVALPYRREPDQPFDRYVESGRPGGLGRVQRVDGRRADGSTFLCELSLTAFRADGEAFFAGVARELGEPERAVASRGEARLRNIIDSLAALVAVYSPDGVMLDVNQAALDAGGVRREDAVGLRVDQTPWVSHSAETGARVLQMVRRAAAGAMVRGELDIQIAPGVYRYLDVILVPLRDATGAITEVLTSGIDVTERRHAQDEVQRRLRQQEAVARLGALALKSRDLPILLTTAVEATSEVLGTDRCTVAVEIDARVRRPAMVREHDRISGLCVPIEGHVGPYGVLAADARPPHHFTEDEATFLQSVANILADVVRHTQTETQLSQERDFSETLIESLPGLIALADERGTMVRWNPALERFWGEGPDAVARLHLLDFVAVDERPLFEARMRDVFEVGRATVEGHARSRDGVLTPMVFSAQRVMLRGKPHLLGVALDISDRRRLEEQLRHSQKMEALGRLAGGIAHDFNNLLTVITGFGGLTLASLAPDDPNRENIVEITQAADSAASLTRQLLAFSRRTMIEPVILDLNAVVGDMETMLRRLLGEDVQFGTALEPALRHIRGDVGLISQVLMNLAVNARDAMPDGGRLTIGTRNSDLDAAFARAHPGSAPGRYASLIVADTGAGMPPDVQARAFEPFFTTKGVGRGSGLGLAVVHGIVEQSGACIELASQVGTGTTFTLHFPAIEGEVPVRPAAASTALTGTGTILLVEDEEGVRKLARMILERNGYTVIEAASGEEALRVLDQHDDRLDMLVTDVVMPGIDGGEVAAAATRRFPSVKVLYLSGYTSDAVVRSGIQHNEVAFLQKPFSATSLAAKVRDVLLDG